MDPSDRPRKAAVISMDIRREFRASPAVGRLTRQALDGWLSDLVGEETAAAARLAACELVDNAVRHGGLSEQDTIRSHRCSHRRNRAHRGGATVFDG